MLESEGGYGEDLLESVPQVVSQEERIAPENLTVRRRIESIRELRRLRELLDDPDFDDPDFDD